MSKLTLEAINYLGVCGSSKFPEKDATQGLVVASFELGEASIEKYQNFLKALTWFVSLYNETIDMRAAFARASKDEGKDE